MSPAIQNIAAYRARIRKEKQDWFEGEDQSCWRFVKIPRVRYFECDLLRGGRDKLLKSNPMNTYNETSRDDFVITI